jgi:antimicrobial peptide system SdpB family protein
LGKVPTTGRYAFEGGEGGGVMLTRLGQWADRVSSANPWSNVYGLARTLLAVGTLVTLAATPIDVLFQRASGADLPPVCSGVRQIGAFCVAPRGSLEIVRWLAVILLLVVAIGWRPRLTGVVHWWLAFSLQASSTIADGGDQAASVLTLLLAPLTLLDGRRWHWQADESRGGWAARISGHVTLLMCRLQVAGIYLHAAAGKFMHEEWANGTAVYYWFTHPWIGAHGWMLRLLKPLVITEAVAIITWGTVVFEFFLAAAIVAPRRIRSRLFWPAIAFHIGILLIHGLVSFAIIMSGSLVLLMRLPGEEFAGIALATVKRAARCFVAPLALERPAWSPSRSKT